jgi:trigger factor
MLVKNVGKKEKSTVSFDVVCDADEFEKALQAAYLKKRPKIFVQGFRKGKAPRMIIEGMYGKEFFYEDAVDEIGPSAFEYAVGEEKLRTVGMPALKNMDVSDDKVLTLTFVTGVWPEVTLGQYKGLEAPRPAVEVTDEQVEREVERARARSARIVTVERPAKKGDTAVIDYKGTVDGVAFEGGSAKGHSLELGSGSFIPGFEEQVEGMSAGEEKDINVTFPEDYNETSLKGKPAVFHVKCTEVKEKQLPDLDDEFAKDISEFDTLTDYRASVRKNLTDAANKNADEEFHSALLEKAVDNMDVELPDGMVEEQLDRMMKETAQNLQMQGLSLELYLKYLNMDAKAFREQSRGNATRRCLIQVLLDKVADAEAIKIPDEDVEAEYKRVAEEYSTDIESVKKAVPADAITDDLRVRRAADVIYGTGIATEPVKEEPKNESVNTEPEKTADQKDTGKGDKEDNSAGENEPAADKTKAE